MNNVMIATVSLTRVNEEGQAKKVTEQHIVPGDTFSTAEEFVYENIFNAGGVSGTLELRNLKKEYIDDIIYEDREVLEKWYKCTVEWISVDNSKQKSLFYVNATSVESATSTLLRFIDGRYPDYTIKSVAESKVIEIHEEDSPYSENNFKFV